MGAGKEVMERLKRLLGHRQFPVWLALGAVLLMLPALKTGLVADDLVLRLLQFKLNELPPQIQELVPPDTGTLPRVLSSFFASLTRSEQLVAAKNYGLVGWWAPEDMRFGLWRPLSAFTHWLDYQFFPNGPLFMHAHNIAWFAAAVFLVATIYGRLAPSAWVGGLAGLLFLLDKNTYFPVMFVANRSFIVALVFGLLALHAHHRWSTTQSRAAMVLSSGAFAAALFANEGGASSLAFILAYALMLESGSWRRRFLSVLPVVIVLLGWRLIYQGLGNGVARMGGGIDNVGGYIDPSQEPLRFGGRLVSRLIALAGGQLTGVPPEALLGLNASWQTGLVIFYLVFLAAGCIVFLPVLRQSARARFWLAVMVLALIPAATVTPLSKNLTFVAVGAFGLVACFIGGLMTGSEWVPKALPARLLSRAMCVWLLLACVPGALVGRIACVGFLPWGFAGMNRLVEIPNTANMGQQDVVLINPPLQVSTVYAPCYRLYRGRAVPRSLRALVPGYAGFELQRPDERTLIVQTRLSDIFACEDLGPACLTYLFRSLDGIVVGRRPWRAGDSPTLKGLRVEILAVSQTGLPARMAFHFERSLNSPLYHWLRFDWRRFAYTVFPIPSIGETILVEEPMRLRR
jgi:hypothetical protein